MGPEVKKAVTIFLAFVGGVSGLIGILVAPPALLLPSILLLAAVLLGLFIWLLLRRFRREKPRQISAIKVDDITDRYSIKQATPEEIEWIAQLEAKVYTDPPEDAIPEQILREWYESNRSGFSVMRMNGRKMGHIDILPLRPKTLESFIEGHIKERDIRGDCLYSPDEKAGVRNLYVESIIIRDDDDHEKPSPMALKFLLCNFITLTKRLCDINAVERVYAIAATEDGEELMRSLGFKQVKSGQQRADHHNLYVAEFGTLRERLSGICNKRPQR
jgi:hypothetical protein